MHILFWRKNEKFRKSRNNQNLLLKKLTILTKNMPWSKLLIFQIFIKNSESTPKITYTHILL
jgi:hypothetical protein